MNPKRIERALHLWPSQAGGKSGLEMHCFDLNLKEKAVLQRREFSCLFIFYFILILFLRWPPVI